MEHTYKKQAAYLMEELIAVAKLEPGEIVVLGCSTSEVLGQKIGSSSSLQVAEELVQGILQAVQKANLQLAVQCCEHLNRALIVEKEVCRLERLTRVNVLPQPKAGGSAATAAWQLFKEPVAVERLEAAAGLDIGQTMVGMHLRPVAVPVRLSQSHIGQAIIGAARTRPKFVGGERAIYQKVLL